MLQYFAIADYKEGQGTINPVNSNLSLFFTVTYNIRQQDLRKAFNNTPEFLVFTTEKEMIKHFKTIKTFDPQHPLAFKTLPLFKVESNELFSDNPATVSREKLNLISGKLAELDFDIKIPRNAPYIPLADESKADEIIYHSQWRGW